MQARSFQLGFASELRASVTPRWYGRLPQSTSSRWQLAAGMHESFGRLVSRFSADLRRFFLHQFPHFAL